MKKLFLLFYFLINIIFCADNQAKKISKPYLKSNIDKGFAALNEYDYFKAKKVFYTCAIKYRKLADFGLATIYYRKDNPFHNIDSAYACIKRSEDVLMLANSKTQKKMLKWKTK